MKTNVSDDVSSAPQCCLFRWQSWGVKGDPCLSGCSWCGESNNVQSTKRSQEWTARWLFLLASIPDHCQSFWAAPRGVSVLPMGTKADWYSLYSSKPQLFTAAILSLELDTFWWVCSISISAQTTNLVLCKEIQSYSSLQEFTIIQPGTKTISSIIQQAQENGLQYKIWARKIMVRRSPAELT